MDYKLTLNMPKTSFSMKANLNKLEPEIQSFWINNDIYKKTLLKNKKNKTFFLHDGPPYANGNIHVGHALNKVIKDIIIRSKNMQGFHAPFVMGWDTHGLPIELAMLKKNKDARNFSTLEVREACKKYALEQIENQKSQFMKMGLNTDFDDYYVTLNEDFQIEQLNLFNEMIKQNLIFRDKKPIYWSWSSQSALAEAEIEYKDVESDSIHFLFELKDKKFEGVKAIVWTTTPWTLPSNRAIAVNPKFEYAVISVNKNKYLVEKSLIEKVSKELEFSNVKIISTHLGKELENIEYQHPFYNDVYKFILADYVTNDDGTGLVHNAPGFGLDDYLACKEYGIEIFCPINNYGKFTDEIDDKELVDNFYTSVNPIIIKRLEDNKLLLKHKKIIHSAAHDWRTKKPVMYRATEQWFVGLSSIQNNISDALLEIKNNNNQKTINRIQDVISRRVEWCISRQRVWGVPIPIIYEDNKPILDNELIYNIIDVLSINGIDSWFDLDVSKFLTSKYLNTNKTYTKETDIMDVWFDSGSSHNIMKKRNIAYPADLYFEGNDQFRGWFNSSLITGVIQHNKAPYRDLLSHGFVLDEKGLKMSKSRGNIVDPLKVFNNYGVDVFRLWAANSEYREDQKIGDNLLKQTSEIYRRIRNTLFRFSLANLEDFDTVNDLQSEFELEDKFILNKLSVLLNEIDENYNNYQFSKIIKLINEFTLFLSSWYFDFIKDTLYCESTDSVRTKQIKTVLYYILINLTKALAPIIPHTTEEVYRTLKNVNEESIHLESWFELNKFVEFKEAKMFEEFFAIKDKVYNLLEASRKNEILKKNTEAIVSFKKLTFDQELLQQYLMVAKVVIDPSQKEEIVISNSLFNKCERCWLFKEQELFANADICTRCLDIIEKRK